MSHDVNGSQIVLISNCILYFGTLFVDYAITGMRYVGELTPGWALLAIVSALNHSANFFLYIISGRHFRSQFIAIMLCKKPEDLSVTSTS